MKLNEIADSPKIAKTKKGSRIARSKYGVGKFIGGNLYLHRSYATSLPSTMQTAILDAESSIGDFKYNTLKINTKDNGVTFINSPDFDSAPEPTVGDYVTVKDGKLRKGSSSSIWHHKWLWVKDDYRGFDVDDSFDRSTKYLKMDIDFSRIGNRGFWEKNYARKL